ncbi:NPCBM/NEW2 domain-containing protein [Romboutsia sp. Marseille-P6047]|uniref:NPCBM/NEW2 domain-containing protein n=1 Tax=Romboutsia sp. Marseille-P6047 TaxID=2161817 RepID=UPI000F05B510|nr:NPCBM/NEW2 domain-containing protein [Romboutsia sp. Marseille-P6047]
MKKKLASILAISIIATNTTPTINVFADEIVRNKATSIEKEVNKNMTVETFKIKNYENFARYNDSYKVNIKSITNNGGKYNQSIITNAIDGKLETHWETGRENKADFKNEVEFEFENIEKINRLAYATRQDGARPKGYPKVAQILVTDSDESEYTLVGEVASNRVTGDMVEFKFDTVEAKKVKFIFSDAHDGWASASEFWFYKEDKILDKMENIFTNDDMNEVNPEFTNLESLKSLEKEAKNHPFYTNFKEDIYNAITILEGEKLESTLAKVSKLTAYGTEYQDDYNEKFMIPTSKITKVEANGGIYPGTKYEYMFDGDPNTHWETNKSNSMDFTNEITLTLDEAQIIDRLAYKARSSNNKGFPTKFEIQVSETSKGETFQTIATGEAKVTSDMVEFKFAPTKAKRVKLVFNQCNTGRAFASEIRLYKKDELSEKYSTLFTNDKKNEISSEFNSIDKLGNFAKELEQHPLYNLYKEGINDARLILENKKVTYVDARVSKFKAFGSPELAEYDKAYKIDNSRIVNITTNGGHYSNEVIARAIDGNIETSWHSSKTNNENHINEVTMTLDQLETIDKIIYTSPRARGFAEEFDIYVSKTLEGETFEKVTSGRSSRTNDSVSIKFNPTEARRVKFLYTKAYENFALAYEFGLYKQDPIIDKMDNLFIDETMSKVSEEFANIEALNRLEDEVKVHPFYEDFREDIENAKALVEQGEIEATVSKTKKFNHYNNKEYMEQYAIKRENIKKISNNGGQWSTMKIDNAIDGDLDTYWETNTSNKEDWKNEVTVEFINPITIDKLVYGARKSDRKGFLEEFEIYASTTTKGDNFKLVSTAKSDKTTGLVEAKFEPTKFQRLRIKVTKGDQNWATLNELIFLKEDSIADKVYNMFINDLMNELVDDYDTIEEIESLEREVSTHSLKEELMEYIKRAKEIVKNPEQAKEYVYELESRGDSIKESQKRQMWNFQDWQPTGLAVKSGQQITVYVDSEPGTPTPRLVFKQMDSQHNGNVNLNLSPGKNVITIPELDSNELRPNVAKAGVLYTVNPYTKDQQIRNPKIKIEGAFEYPAFVLGQDDDEVIMKELEKYTDKLKEDPTLPDVFEVFSKKNLVNTRATYALDWYKKNNLLPSYTANKVDEILAESMKFWGFDGSNEVNSDYNYRYVSMLKWLDNGGFMNAGNGITGYNQNEQGAVLGYNTGWGLMHELGHNMDTAKMSVVEVTNNMLPLHFEVLEGKVSRFTQQNQYKNNIFPKVTKADYSENIWYPENDYTNLQHIAPLWQLQLYDETFWPRLQQEFRENPSLGGGNWDNKHQAWAVAASNVMQMDLTEHFARHGFSVTKETEEHMKQYPKPDGKIWYMNDNKYLKDGETFNEDFDLKLHTKINKENITLTMELDKENNKSLLGYEIYRDGKLIGFTNTETYVDKEANIGTNHNYEVVAFSNDLNVAEGVTVKSHQPKLDVQKDIVIELNKDFNALDYVEAFDYEGNKLNNITVEHNVDTSRKGEYEVTYKITQDGATLTDTTTVTVVSDFTYLTDLKHEDVKVGWGSPKFNKDIYGRVNGISKKFQKGIGLHANGYVVYNLGEHNYDTLDIKLGTDSSKADSRTTLDFKIIGDGKVLAKTDIKRYTDDLEHIKLNIADVKELRIEVSIAGDSDANDHGIIVEPKLIGNNSKPVINIDESQSIKVGDTLENVIGNIEATDKEDGNLTKNVKISGQDKVNTNRVGIYPITYTVEDSDGNITVATRNIKVVNMDDFTYLSDYNWKSQSNNYTQAKKDVAISGRKLTLTGENNEAVEYEKGLGMHSTSTVIYDLTDKNADIFSTYIGVDRAMYNSVGQVQFEIYVDGKLAYDSGIIRAKDKQKYIEVNLADAKELKLVVKDGGNGNGSDHATFGDAKLHFVNTSRVDKTELTNLVNDAKNLNEDNYLEESFNAMQIVLVKAERVLEDNSASQEDVDNVSSELKESIKELTEINLDEVVNIPDKYLAKSLSNALGKSEGFTVGDMRSLTELSLSGVTNLEGLQYANNLVSIESEYNEIKDLRPLAKLKNLEKANFKNQFVSVGELSVVDGSVTVNTEAYNRAGKNVATKVVLVDRNGNVLKEEAVNNAAEISLDVSSLERGIYGVHVSYEDDEISGILMNIATIK